MNAEEARELSNKSEQIKNEVDNILKEVTKAAMEGKFSTIIEGAIGADCCMAFRNKGYKIRYINRNSMWNIFSKDTEITWSGDDVDE